VPDVLTTRQLSRATLHRQLLLRREPVGALEVMERLVGLQGQDPEPPYVGLWTRIAGFRHDELTRLVEERRVVRATLFRGTQHLVTTDDYRWLRPLLGPMLATWQRGSFRRVTPGVDPAELADAARAALGDGVLSRPELGRRLAERWGDVEPEWLARSVQGLLPVIHPHPDGVWGRRGPTPFMLAEPWLGRPLDPAPDPRRLVRRYLAAFGPAAVADIRAWSGMAGLREVVGAMRGELRPFRDEHGRELLDLPDAPRPPGDVPAPVRFLAPLDNVVLAYDDRGRVVAEAERPLVGFENAMTVDGFVHGFWRIRRAKGTATLAVRLHRPLTAADRAEAETEGRALLRFAAANATHHEVTFTPAP
jgi:hypothetical protein